MKKTLIVIFVGLALAFMAAPSQALVGIDDNVPGVNPLLPFFLVDKAGFPNSGLDTLVVIQEIGGGGDQFKTKGNLHLIIRDKASKDKGSCFRPYTPNDVLALSVRDIIDECVGVGPLPELEIVLNGVTYYTGYVDFFNSIVDENNLVAFMYVIDLAHGWAAANTMPVWEGIDGDDYAWGQHWHPSDGLNDYTVERFSPNAYAISQYRERFADKEDGQYASSFRLMPRWALKDLNAETFIPIWSSSVHSTSGTCCTYELIGDIYDNVENVLNLPIRIPWEVNWLDVRELLTSSWQTKPGGWIDIDFDYSQPEIGDWPFGSSWLAYSYQTASGAGMGNWSVLHGVHREVGTLLPEG